MRCAYSPYNGNRLLVYGVVGALRLPTLQNGNRSLVCGAVGALRLPTL
ncbi:hypothetical protein SMC87_000303 [Cronobacter dublinensis]|nr:hypothetical protein [Cronobacter dublinensis]